ncbi:hypothetical protein ES703_118759 [subsurface metagenome]
MVKAMMEIPERENRILTIVKGQHGFSTKEEACIFIIGKHEQSLELEIRPEFVKEMKKTEKGKHYGFKDTKDLRKQIEG